MKTEFAHQIELENREQLIINSVSDIEKINKKIAKLRLEKETKEGELISLIGHSYEGSKTYPVGEYSVTLKTDMIYSLDKELYANGEMYLPAEFDPIVKKVNYEVNKKLFIHYSSTAPESVRSSLSTLITLKPSKPSVSIKVRS